MSINNLNDLKKLNDKLDSISKTEKKEIEYLISFMVTHQRPSQKLNTVEDTIIIKIEPTKDSKEFLIKIKKEILKIKFKDTRVENLKKLIIFNLTRLN